jgi:ribosome-binding protein aMBF1 (putative translation factor)
MVEYLEGRIAGNDALRIFNREVQSGRRRGKLRNENIPFTRPEGLRLSHLENARKARAAYAVNVGEPIQERIRKNHQQLKLGHIRLSKKYGFSVSVIRRILGER